MKYELGWSEEEASYALLFQGDDRDVQRLPSDAEVIWTCEASTYEEAPQKRNDYLGWGEHRPVPGERFDYPPGARR